MGPKARTPDQSVQFVLQLLASIKDVNGRCVSPNYRALEDICGIKHNSIYVRYRELVNQQIALGVQGLQPIGTRAIEAAAKPRIPASCDIHLAPVSMPTAMQTPANTSKTGKRSRKRTPHEYEDGPDNDGDSDFGPSTSAMRKKMKPTCRLRQTSVPPKPNSQPTAPPAFELSFDFDHGADLLAVDERHHFDIDRGSDIDAEGESDC